MTSASPGKRRDMDVVKLLMSDYKVEMVNDGTTEFYVEFHGPKDSPYCGGLWRVHVELPDAYPYKSPSIGFVNKMYHPNVDETAGSVCLDVINQTSRCHEQDVLSRSCCSLPRAAAGALPKCLLPLGMQRRNVHKEPVRLPRAPRKRKTSDLAYNCWYCVSVTLALGHFGSTSCAFAHSSVARLA